MFRQLLALQRSHQQQIQPDDIAFPNLNQLVKVETINVQRNITFSPFLKINIKTNTFQTFLDILQQFKQDKIKFVAKIQEQASDDNSIEISQSPIHVDQGCNYFLLRVKYSCRKIQTDHTTKSRFNSPQGFTQSKFDSRHKSISTQRKQAFFKLVYILCQVIYLPAENLNDFLNAIKIQSKIFCGHPNILKIVKIEGLQKKSAARVSSTAAQTKFQNEGVESQFFEDDPSFIYKAKQSRSNNTVLSPKNYFTEGSFGYHSRASQTQNKLFSRISLLEVKQKDWTERILEEVGTIRGSVSSEHLKYNTIIKILQRSKNPQSTISTLQQFDQQRSSDIQSQKIFKIVSNYQNAIEEQFNSIISQKSIDQIKLFLKKLYQNSIMQICDEIGFDLRNLKQNTSNHKGKDKNGNKNGSSTEIIQEKLLQIQKTLFSNINKGKKQSFHRKFHFLTELPFFQRTVNEKEKKFEILLNTDRISKEGQIGFGLYRQTVKEKLSEVFSQLLQQTQPKRPAFKSHKNKSMTRHELAHNMDRRIELLMSQKRNLQQTLHCEQKLQQNLIEYVKGQQNARYDKKQVQTISQSQQRQLQ